MANKIGKNNKGTRGRGRPKGSPNKTTAAVKDAIANAFAKVGGEDYLVQVAQSDPKTFCQLLGKVIPMQVTGDSDNPIAVVTKIELVAPNERNAKD